MKKIYTFLASMAFCLGMNAQTQHISNGNFDANPWNSLWSTYPQFTAPGGGVGYCASPSSPNSIWFGSGNGQFGQDNFDGEIHQDFYIPATTANGYTVQSARVYFDASINTSEVMGGGNYDFLYVDIYNFGGAFNQTLGALNNNSGQYQFNSCQPFSTYFVDIPLNLLNSYLILSFHATTDAGFPTLFRLDNVRIEATYTCNLILGTTNATVNSNAANNIVISSVNTGDQQTGCTWSATVTSGNSWLTCNSSGQGNGNVLANVTANATTSPRVGTIDVVGTNGTQTITVTQSGANCTYTLSTSNFTCPDSTANIYTNISNVTAPSGCAWTATVTNGSSWLSTSSTGNGNGLISILVSANSTGASRTGTISINGTNLVITQPGSTVGFEELSMPSFSVFPNPANNLLTIRRPNASENQVFNLADITGKTIQSGNLVGKNTVVDISELPQGLYFLSIPGNFERAVKVIKQ